jgi:hypothetical protein
MFGCIYILSVVGRGKWCTGQLSPLRCWRWPSKLPLPSSHLYPLVSCLFWNCVLACLEFLALPIVSGPYPVLYSRRTCIGTKKRTHAHSTRAYPPPRTHTRTPPRNYTKFARNHTHNTQQAPRLRLESTADMPLLRAPHRD